MTLSVEQISKLEDCKIRAKKVYENYDEKLNNFLNEQLVELKKQDNSISNFSEDEIKDLKISFQAIQSEKKMWAIMGLALSAYPSGISPIIFGAINILFNSLGFFNSQERFFKQIMEAVERLIDKKLSQERERQSEEYFSRNGTKNVNCGIIPNDIQAMTNEQLSSSLQFQLMIYRDKITDGLIYLRKKRLSSLGKEWGFSDFDVEDAKKKIHDYTIQFFETTVTAGWMLSRHIHGNASPYLGYHIPPYFDAVRKFKNADFTYFPHRAFDYQRNAVGAHFNCGDERGSHLLYPGITQGFTLLTNSLSSGFKELTGQGLNIPATLVVNFESAKRRSFKVKIHHQILGNAKWIVKSGNVTETLAYNEGTEKEIRNSYFVFNENFENSPHGTNESKLITVENEQVTIDCVRSVEEGSKD
ncbi:hypothetical protein ACTFIR_006152 [Dictyostelium discoideum]